jgi:hypothetical protein
MAWQNPAAASCCAMAARQAMLFQRPTCCAPVRSTTWRWACGWVACAGARRARGVAGAAARRAGCHCGTQNAARCRAGSSSGGAGARLGAAARCAAAGRAHRQPGPPCQARGGALMADLAASHGQAGPGQPGDHGVQQPQPGPGQAPGQPGDLSGARPLCWPICRCTIFSTAPAARGRPICLSKEKWSMKNFKSFWPLALVRKALAAMFL